MKRLAIVGSTGSIGQNTLRVVEHLSDRFQVFALAANSATGLLAEQAATLARRFGGTLADLTKPAFEGCSIARGLCRQHRRNLA